MTQERFLERHITFANGSSGEAIEFESANPANYADVILGRDFPHITIDGKLFLPPEPIATPTPVVIVAPGSVGVAESHIMHTERLTDWGYAAFLIDPFGARSVTSTVANQTQFSFAGSAYDVLAAAKMLSGRDGLDARRIGVQGHSRGGSAALMAAMQPFQRKVLTNGETLKAIYAVYPWCGHQLRDPDIGSAKLRMVIGEQDNWCSPQQAQGYAQAIRLSGGDATFRMFAGAHHSFDRLQSVEEEPEAKVAPHAPTIYLDEQGAFLDPISGEPDADGTEADFMIYAAKAGFLVTGASLGSSGDLAEEFRKDMQGFWAAAL
jgi:dienelactone hydrolase